MSVRIMTKAWGIDVKGSDKLILLALADNASDEGYCFPSWNTIISKTGVSRGTLAKSLKTLEKLNLIKRISRKRDNGSDASNGYFVIENIGQSSETEHHPEVQKLNYQSSETEHLEPSYNHQYKKINKKVPQQKPKNLQYPSEFESVWSTYRVGDKWVAYKAFTKRSKDYSLEELKRAVNMENKKEFGKRHFSTVLNGDIDELISANKNSNNGKGRRYV